MRVLYIVTAYPRSPGDVITPWLVETIRRLRERGIEVEVLAPAYRGSGNQVVDGVRVHRFRYAPAGWETLTHDQTAPDRVRESPRYLGLVPGYVAAGSLAAARLARTGGFAAVHAFWPLPHGLLGMAAKRWSGVPLVSTFFGVELTWAERELRLARPLIRAIVAASDAVTVISSHTEEAVRRVAPGATVHRIPFGATFDVPPTTAGARSRSPGDPLNLLFVGRLVERKGVHVLLDSLHLLRRRAPELAVSLDVVGDGSMRERWEARARELRLERVRFLGQIPQDDLERAFSAADAFVLPAVRDAKGDVEGLGVVLMEALLHGTPVIASASGGIVDIARDGETGLLVPSGDAGALAAAIERYARDPGLAGRLAERGRAHVESEFSWGAITERLEQIYRTVGRSGREEPSR